MASFFAPSSSSPSVGPQFGPPQPESKFETFSTPLDVSELTPAGEEFDIKKVSTKFLAERYSLDLNSLFYVNGYEDDVTKHAFIGEIYDGIRFSDDVQGHVVFTKKNKVVTVSSSLVKTETASISPPQPTVSRHDAIKKAEETLSGKYVPPSSAASAQGDNDKEFLRYLANPDGSAILVYAIQVENGAEGTSYLAYVDAHEGNVVAAVNFVAH